MLDSVKSPLSFDVCFVMVYFIKKLYSLNCVDEGELCFVKFCVVSLFLHARSYFYMSTSIILKRPFYIIFIDVVCLLDWSLKPNSIVNLQLFLEVEEGYGINLYHYCHPTRFHLVDVLHPCFHFSFKSPLQTCCSNRLFQHIPLFWHCFLTINSLWRCNDRDQLVI